MIGASISIRPVTNMTSTPARRVPKHSYLQAYRIPYRTGMRFQGAERITVFRSGAIGTEVLSEILGYRPEASTPCT